MAHFSGFTCDNCGTVVSTSERTQRTVKIKGPVAQGEFSEDLCSDCVVIPDDVEMKPLRRRTTKASEASESSAPADSASEDSEESGLISPVG